MSKVTATGRVISDPVLRVSVKKTPYVVFTLMERIGLEQYSHCQYLHVWAWDELAIQMSKAGVKRSSWLRINGYLELAACVKRDGITRDKERRVTGLSSRKSSQQPNRISEMPRRKASR